MASAATAGHVAEAGEDPDSTIPETNPMERSLFAFVWKNSKAAQFAIIGLSFLSIPLVYGSLELPKRIIDDAIGGGPGLRTLLGMELSQIGFLFALCGAFLFLVIANNGIKYVLNIKKGLTGERMLRRLRYSIFRRSLLTRDERVVRRPPAEATQIVTAEVEPVGNFMGDIVATPVFQGSTLLVYIVFIFAQDAFLGAAAISLYPAQAILIPMIQRHVIVYTQQRLASIRAMSAELTETIGARSEVVGYGAQGWHLSQMSARLFFNFKTRFRIFRLKFLIKFINNFAAQLTPFFFYAYGGYLVIKGELALGALVAVLAAYKDLAGPWKELLTYYQTLSDMRIRYRMVVAPFVDIDEQTLTDGERRANRLAAPLAFSEVDMPDRTGDGLLRGVDFSIPATGVTALIGDDISGRIPALRALSGREEVERGRIRSDGRALEAAVLVDRVAFVSPDAPVFARSLRFNLAYGALDEPGGLDDAEGAEMRTEAALTGSAPGDMRSAWYGGDDTVAIDDRILDIAALTGFERELYRQGLRTCIDPAEHPELVASVLAARGRIGETDMAERLGDKVAFWNPAEFNAHATLGENLLFHTWRYGGARTTVSAHPAVARLMDDDPFGAEMLEIGAEIARTLLSVFEDITRDKELITQFGLFSHGEMPLLQRALARLERRGIRRLRADERALLRRIAFDYCPARHRIGAMRKGTRTADLLAARARFADALSAEPDLVSFRDENYIGSLTVADNLLNGIVRRERSGAWPPIETTIDELVGQSGFRAAIARMGLEATMAEKAVGGTQRRRIAAMRALLSDRPVIAVEGFSGLDPRKEAAFAALIAASAERAVVVGVPTVEEATLLGATHGILFSDGVVVGAGPPGALDGATPDGDDTERGT